MPQHLFTCILLDLRSIDIDAVKTQEGHEELCHHFRMDGVPILVMLLVSLFHFRLRTGDGLMAHSRKGLRYNIL